jgi:hypothetical protein
MKREHRSKPVRKDNAIPQQIEAKRIAPATPTSASLGKDSNRIYLNADGELAISQAGSRKIQTTFTGSNVENNPEAEGSTDLENARFGQAAGTLPYAKGQCGSPQVLNIALGTC